jgi:hypothetical protein
VYAVTPDEQKDRCLRSLWEQVIGGFKQLRFETLLLQYTVYGDNVFLDRPVTFGHTTLEPDPKDIIRCSLGLVAEVARARGLELWVGLRLTDRWNRASWPELVGALGGETAAGMLGTADAVARTGVEFGGWYISIEIGNYVPDIPTAVHNGNRWLADVTAKLKRLAPKPVAISIYFREATGNLAEEEFCRFLTATLTGTGLDVLIFQDGVGLSDSPEHPQTNLSPAQVAALQQRYLRVADACHAAEVRRMWADVELCAGTDRDEQTLARHSRTDAAEKKAPAAQFGRVLDQCGAVRGAETIVGFEACECLTPLDGRPGSAELYRAHAEHATGRPPPPLNFSACPHAPATGAAEPDPERRSPP